MGIWVLSNVSNVKSWVPQRILTDPVVGSPKVLRASFPPYKISLYPSLSMSIISEEVTAEKIELILSVI